MGWEKKTLLQVDKLSIGFIQKHKMNKVVDNVSFTLNTGEILGIVGESGSGKSMTALAIMGLLSKDAKVIDGSIKLEQIDLLSLKKEELRRVRGKEIAMIFQEPMTSLNPVMTIGYQIEEMLILHEKELNHDERKLRVFHSLKEAGLSDVEGLYMKYPHQLSGGMRQRVMIAMAMICKPKVLIADEPTTALDVTIQKKILELIKELNCNYGTSVIFISHDLGVVKSICNRALVMKDGTIEEVGKIEEIYKNPTSEYTKELIASIPNQFSSQKESSETDKHGVNVGKTQDGYILKINDFSVHYEEKTTRILKKNKDKIVVNHVSLQLNQGEILGIVGESGSGKSTLAKAIAGLIPHKTGDITVRNTKPQMVFQDPYGSLNPAKKVGWILEEPLKISGKYKKKERKEKVDSILDKVGLSPNHAQRYLNQLSGGQRQRVAIGVALIQESKLIILDEPVSALDVTIQKQILDLLKKLQVEQGLSYLFISHDLNVIRKICDRVCVMYQGNIVETSPVEKLFCNPSHPYTKELLEAIL